MEELSVMMSPASALSVSPGGMEGDEAQWSLLQFLCHEPGASLFLFSFLSFSQPEQLSRTVDLEG